MTYGFGTFAGRPAFGANWRNVDYFQSSASNVNRNTFQALLVDRSDIAVGDFDIVFNYGQIRWETGTFSGGDANGLGGSSARVGYTIGTGEAGTFFELPGGGIPGTFLDGGSAPLVAGSLNSSVPGRYIFEVRNGAVLPPPGFSCSDLQQVVGQWGETNSRCGNITSNATTPRFESARLDGGVTVAESRGGPTGYVYTVDAVINRPRQPTAANSIFVHGTPNPLQSGAQWWNRKLAFNISGDGRYSIFRYNGTARPAAIQTWTPIIGASLAVPPATNTLQVVSSGTQLTFALNGVPLRTINSEFVVEDFGIGLVRSVPGAGAAGDDWIEIEDATVDAGTMIAGGGPTLPRVSAEQEAANVRANSADQLQRADPFFAPAAPSDSRK